MADVAVDWSKYFNSIKTVCPWSLSAWKRGGIDIQSWRGEAIPLDSWDARIYLAPHHKPRQLKKMCDRFNRDNPSEEWLWSHPVFEDNSAPIACFIQQDRERLLLLRQKL